MKADNVEVERKIISFGEFRVIPAERLLLRGGTPIRLGSRAMEILLTLVDRAGEVVTARDLYDRVWPGLSVEESNLRVNLSALRKALSDDGSEGRFIINIPGRGYSFIADIRVDDPGKVPSSITEKAQSAFPLPGVPRYVVGRASVIDEIVGEVFARQFVSVVGPGGMGKTTVALAAANEMLAHFKGNVCFLDLGKLVDEELVVGELCVALKVRPSSGEQRESLLDFLQKETVLLVLDNCEHLIQKMAELCEELFRAAPKLHLLTTSREALRVEGETVFILPPLEGPDIGENFDATASVTTPAMQLFLERARSSGHRKLLTEEEVFVAANICQRLDGIPLAIEIVASHVGANGVMVTADLLNNRFRLLWQGRRTALPRHHTLKAMLDWSYLLLSPGEQQALRHLSVFTGNFNLESAAAVFPDGLAAKSELVVLLERLVSKSLLWSLESGAGIEFRLAETTIAFAREKLEEQREFVGAMSRHAAFLNEVLSKTLGRGAGIANRHEVKVLAPYLFDVRAALNWCFKEDGDVELGVNLAAHAAGLFLGRSHLAECISWSRRALAKFSPDDPRKFVELKLSYALAVALEFSAAERDEVGLALDRASFLADQLEEREVQLHLLAGRSVYLSRYDNPDPAISAAEESLRIAERLPGNDPIIAAHWLLASAYFVAGHQQKAQKHGKLALAQSTEAGRNDYALFGYDQRSRGLVTLALTLWMRGQPRRASEIARQSVCEATERGTPIDLCLALTHTAPVFHLNGDYDAADRQIEQGLYLAKKNSIGRYEPTLNGLRAELLIDRGEVADGVALMANVLPSIRRTGARARAVAATIALARGYSKLGEHQLASGIVAEARMTSDRGFLYPEVLRRSAEIELEAPQPDIGAADVWLRRALDLSRFQHALGWELRTVTSLAKLMVKEGKSFEARDLLDDTLKRFSDIGFSHDLRCAVRLLETL